ncbi:uncharacterized protein [Nicotiana tomentosiformis]|uniref:uncharacterized protein n=1 Tax=Nicotiana tomentosiformis TaxID=4098 RepID=UPI00388CAFE8
MRPPVKKKLRKFKPNMSLKIKEEVIKRIKAKVLRVVEYLTWLANIVSVPKKDGKVVNGQALADHLAENHVDGEYEPLKTYFSDEEVSFVGEDITETYNGWRMFFDGAANFKEVGIGVVLVSEIGQHYPVSAKLRFPYTNNMEEYEAYILGLRLAIDMNVQKLLVIGDFDLLVYQVLGEWATKNTKILTYLYYVQELMKRFIKIEFKHVPKIQNDFADALDTLYSMIQHPDKNFIDHIPIRIHKQPAYCAHVEEEIDGNPWFHDIKEYLAKGKYRTTVHTSIGTTPFLLVYGTEAVIPAEVEIPSLGIIQEAELSDAE